MPKLLGQGSCTIPHRALSSEFASLPIRIWYRQLIRQTVTCRLFNVPPSWLNNAIPEDTLRRDIRTSINSNIHGHHVFAWSNPAPPDPAKREFLSCLDVPGDIVCKKLFSDSDVVVFTDGLLFIKMEIVIFLCLNSMHY